ncbi:MAG TPA: hypothetical protein VMW01_15460 [Williamwhitmania sp.]|nr:hypothetical protein [Williamwhitmania sp.]
MIDSHIANIAKDIKVDSYKYQLSNYVNFLVQCFIAAKICTPRDIVKFKNAGNINYKGFLLPGNSNIRNYELLIPIIFDILSEMFGNNSKISSFFTQCVENIENIQGNIDIPFSRDILLNSALFMYSLNNSIKDENNFVYEYRQMTISFMVQRKHYANNGSKSTYFAISLEKESEYKHLVKLCFEILNDAFTSYIKIKNN